MMSNVIKSVQRFLTATMTWPHVHVSIFQQTRTIANRTVKILNVYVGNVVP